MKDPLATPIPWPQANLFSPRTDWGPAYSTRSSAQHCWLKKLLPEACDFLDPVTPFGGDVGVAWEVFATVEMRTQRKYIVRVESSRKEAWKQAALRLGWRECAEDNKTAV